MLKNIVKSRSDYPAFSMPTLVPKPGSPAVTVSEPGNRGQTEIFVNVGSTLFTLGSTGTGGQCRSFDNRATQNYVFNRVIGRDIHERICPQ